jgi:DNA-binding NarL/FixJ family response regulator
MRMSRPEQRVGGDDEVQARPRSILGETEWRSISRTLRLSAREFQIVQGIFDGQPEASIAGALGISPHTVHTYVERIYRKLGVGSRCELVIRIFATYLSMESGHRRGAAAKHRGE